MLKSILRDVDQNGCWPRYLFGGMILDTQVLEGRSCCCSRRGEALLELSRFRNVGRVTLMNAILLGETRAESGIVERLR